MSVAAYLGKVRELRLNGWSVPAIRVEGPVLEGALSVEEARGAAERPPSLPRGTARPTYESVAHYDPVLRSHCRLDQEGSRAQRDLDAAAVEPIGRAGSGKVILSARPCRHAGQE